MKYHKTISALFAICILVSCGKKDVQSACYSNGDHEKMSDGRITRICMCVAKGVSAMNLSEKENGWVIDVIEGDTIKELSDKEKDQLKEIKKRFYRIKSSCEAVK